MTARNRLADQTSPYLLQHAGNPVDWFPWGDDAIAEARRRRVPIFLSIGYSTCYWCHVMERESFEDHAVAQQMNEHFVCIKVDREERPDLDDAYMAATQIMTGRGGWPMSVFLEPEHLRPFWCGTYFPKTPRPGISMPTFPTVLDSIARAWRDQRDEVHEQARHLAEAVREHLAADPAPVPLHAGLVSRAAGTLLQMLDRTHGGFGGAPKFPQVVYLDFLLDIRHAADEPTRDAVDTALRHTLERMALGGIHDHLAGGFHRYSVDAHWTVPHFEKMLYDQAQLALAYARAAHLYDDPFHARTARRTLDYVAREMTGPQGQFLSAQDAEVAGREGLNYLWTRDEILDALGPDDGPWAARVFGVDAGPNFKDPHHHDAPAASVLRLADRPDDTDRLDRVGARLLKVRAQRPQPHTDDKTITAWSAMMAEAFARAAALLRDPALAAPAARALAFILDHHAAPDGSLLRVSRAGRAHTPAFLDDYAHTIRALVALHTLGDTTRPWLEHARRLAALAQQRLAAPGGGYFDAPPDAGELFVRTRTTYDGATPSGQSVMLAALVDLWKATGDDAHLHRAADLLSALSPAIADSPVATINATRTLAALLGVPALRAREGLFTDAPPDEPRQTDDARTSPVQVYAGVERIGLKRGEPAELELLINIQDGHHIIAADPGDDAPEGLVPLRVWTMGGRGVEVYADYPEGEPLEIAGAAVRVHHGQVEMRVVLEREGPIDGRPLLLVTYQACSETECRRPVTVELDVAIDPAR